jgi:hypothetical protein
MLVGKVRPNPDASPRRPDETTNEHLLRTGVLYDLVPVGDVVDAVPVAPFVDSPVIVECLSPVGTDCRVIGGFWLTDDVVAISNGPRRRSLGRHARSRRRSASLPPRSTAR